MNEQLKQYIVDVLKEAQESGYVSKENGEFEVGHWIDIASGQIASKADQLLEPERYIKVDGYFYKKRDLQKLEKVEL